MVSFLHVTLLEQTDLAAEMGARRLTDLYRKASGKVLKKQADSSVDLRAERVELKEVLYDKKLTAAQIVAAMRELVPQNEPNFAGTRAQLVREALVKEEAPRVSALLNSLGIQPARGTRRVLCRPWLASVVAEARPQARSCCTEGQCSDGTAKGHQGRKALAGAQQSTPQSRRSTDV